jgi:hypothetical protein
MGMPLGKACRPTAESAWRPDVTMRFFAHHAEVRAGEQDRDGYSAATARAGAGLTAGRPMLT